MSVSAAGSFYAKLPKRRVMLVKMTNSTAFFCEIGGKTRILEF